MVPLPRYTTVTGIPVTQLIEKDKLDAIIERTKVGGGELVGLMGTSAWFAPRCRCRSDGKKAIALDQNRIFPCAAWLTGQYGINDLYVGVPVKLGKGGIKEIIEIELNADEQSMLDSSCNAVRTVFEDLERIHKRVTCSGKPL